MRKLADKIRAVGLVGHAEKLAHSDVVVRAAKMLRAAGREVLADATTTACFNLRGVALPTLRELSQHADMLLVFGGDGTMLRTAREIAGSKTPMLGVNVGTLGFLTAVTADELPAALKHIWAGHFKYESRTLIEAGRPRADHSALCTALNDIVISRGGVSRLIELAVTVNREPLTRYRCDGLIISSPTGSTAYSLAAGGAVVFPTAEVFALTPISPHTLSNRSLILPLTDTIRVKVLSPSGSTNLSADGEFIRELTLGEEVQIRRSRHTVRLMHLADSSFFAALRGKLHWRGANV